MSSPDFTSHQDLSKTVSATKNLRAISMSLVRKVRSTPTISSTEIANQLAREAVYDVLGTVSAVSTADLSAIEKNIRRRLYDSLKVLESIGAIARTKKEKLLTWRGTSHLIPAKFRSTQHSSISTSPLHRSTLLKTISSIRQRLARKNAQRMQLDAQTQALRSLCNRNQTQPAADSNRIEMPFVLIRTPVNTEISLNATPDARAMCFEFSGYYEIVNDASILDRLFVVDKYQQEKSPKRERVSSRAAFTEYAQVSAKKPPVYMSPLRESLRVLEASPFKSVKNTPFRKRKFAMGKRILAPRLDDAT